MPKKKIFILDDDIVNWLEVNKKRFVSEKNLVSVALREYMAKDKKERYEKMLNQLNLKKHDTTGQGTDNP